MVIREQSGKLMSVSVTCETKNAFLLKVTTFGAIKLRNIDYNPLAK
jgi:hypothetical protein